MLKGRWLAQKADCYTPPSWLSPALPTNRRHYPVARFRVPPGFVFGSRAKTGWNGCREITRLVVSSYCNLGIVSPLNRFPWDSLECFANHLPTQPCKSSPFVRLPLHCGHLHSRKLLLSGLTWARYMSRPSPGQLTQGVMFRSVHSLPAMILKYPCRES